ncbi:MAG: histidine--tRNA ligase [Parcubacteria group bacterium]|nr:histidine--tRNA ligase [Parcubacteria group bacterium]
MAKQLFFTPTGMHDILPEDQPYWDKIRLVAGELAKFYDFGFVSTPILEFQAIFERSLGEASDIVEKEMFALKTKGGDELVLRPEGTAPIMRAYLEHGWESLPQPVKVFYLGPMFRHETPQAGRFRQFHQFGFEALGVDDAVLDAELIMLALTVLKELGLKNLICEINSLGDKVCRVKHRQMLKDYLRPQLRKLCPNCQRRYKANTLRILDCKNESCREIIGKAPQILDYICDNCRSHFKKVLEFLDELEIPYLLNPHLVRGLDYYARTVFEIYIEEKRSAQSALASGGRYDGLAELLGGKDVPAVGWAAGVERIIAEMKEAKARVSQLAQPKLFLVQLGDLGKKKSLKLMEEFRRNNIVVAESLSRHSIKSQMKIADKLGVKLALILGQKEALDNEIIIRDMTSGVQETIPQAKLMEEIKKRLKGL